MTTPRRNLLLLLAVALVGAGAYVATTALGGPSGKPAATSAHAPSPQIRRLGRWLELTDEQMAAIAAEDPDFHLDIRRLDREIRIHQLRLASLMESADASEAALAEQFEALAAAHLAMHRRVAKYVLAIRAHLTRDQRGRLLHLLSRQLRKDQGERPGGQGPGGTGTHPQGGRKGGERVRPPHPPHHRPPHGPHDGPGGGHGGAGEDRLPPPRP